MMDDFRERVARHRVLLDRRGFALSWEGMPVEGQGWEWFHDLRWKVPKSARAVAQQLGRLCGHDSEVTVSYRALADAVGHTDRAGRARAFTESGVGTLVRLEWLEVETVGRGRGARTTFRLLPAGRSDGLSSWVERAGEADEDSAA